MRLPGSILQGILARTALVLLRIYLGGVLLLAAWPKVIEGFPHDTGLAAGLIPWGELFVGVILVFGLFTRLAAALVLLLLANRIYAAGAWLWDPASNDAGLAAIAVALLIGAAGRTFGVDALLAKRWPKSPLW